jgi:hypothetical protein
VEYLGEAVSFFRLVSDVNPAVLRPSLPSSWRCRGVRREHCFTRSQWLVVLKLVQEVGVLAQPLLIVYASAMCYRYIASKVATGRNISTLLPGIATLIYVVML